MNGTTKRRVGFGALTGLAIASVIGFSAMNVSGQVTTTAEPYPAVAPYATLTIDITDRAGMLTLELVDGSTLTQEIRTIQPCSTIDLGPILVEGNPAGNPYPGQNLLDLESLVGASLAPGGSVQIPSSLLGVESGTNCGTPSGQLGPDEALKISLGNFAEFSELLVSVESGTLAIGKTNNQDKKLKLAYDSGGFGADIDIPVGGTNVTSGAFADSVTLRSTATSNSRGLSLKGGTTFELVVPTDGDFEYAVECDEAVTDEGGTGEIASTATFYRANDNKGSNQCTDEVGITVEILSDRVFWDNSTIGVNGVEQFVAGLVTVDWAPIPTSLDSATIQDRLAREIDYDAATGGENFVPVEWCSSFIELGADPGSGALAFDVVMPTDVPWCLVSDSQELVGGSIHQTQVYYGQGDPWNR